MNRKKKKVRGLVVTLVVLACVGALLIWQKNNIRALISFTQFSQEELEEKLQENNQTIQDAVDSVPNLVIRDVTQEEKDALKEGTLTQEELVQNLIQSEPKPEPKPEPEPEPEPEQPPVDQPSQENVPPEQSEEPNLQSEYEIKLNALIAEVYVLREAFLIKLDETQVAAMEEYKALPADQRTTKNIANLVGSYLSKGSALEKECDAQIERIVVEIETLLRENGADLSIAQAVYDTYVEEKSLKKAWYMAELKKRGMM